ncbi:MAG: YlbF family regulator [Clostridiales bacterium]|nr:YlbF family regulator [Clostridiales bacterium]
MVTYDNAHKLAKSLKECDEYKEYKKLEEQIAANSETKKMVVDFRKRQFEIQSAQMVGQKIEDNKIEKIKELQEIMMKNPTVSAFMQAEYRLSQMLSDIYKIIGEALDLNFDKDEDEKKADKQVEEIDEGK